MRRHARLGVAAVVALGILGTVGGLIAYVLSGASEAEQDHRAQVIGTILAASVIVPTAVAWTWRTIVRHQQEHDREQAAELAPDPNAPRLVQLAGDWFSAWQSFKDGREVIAVQGVRLTQDRDRIDMETLARGRPVEDGGYHWRGELRLWDNEILMGWYASADSSVRSKGTLYFILHPQGQRMAGRWVGLSYDGDTVTGLGAMARTEDEARRLVTGGP